MLSDPEPPPPDPSLLPPGPAHPTWPGPGPGADSLMLPPPYPPKRVYYSYFERKHQDEAFDDEEENVVDEAKRLKHEADHEANINTKCRKYLQVSHSYHNRRNCLPGSLHRSAICTTNSGRNCFN